MIEYFLLQGLDPFRLDGYLRVCEFILTVACWCSAPLQVSDIPILCKTLAQNKNDEDTIAILSQTFSHGDTKVGININDI